MIYGHNTKENNRNNVKFMILNISTNPAHLFHHFMSVHVVFLLFLYVPGIVINANGQHDIKSYVIVHTTNIHNRCWVGSFMYGLFSSSSAFYDHINLCVNISYGCVMYGSYK